MIRQVFMQEVVVDPVSMIPRSVLALAYGTHPQFSIEFPGDDSQVSTASVAASQKFRIVVDELLIGNYLEQIACRDGSYASVPEGTTPDDVARCAVQADVLPESCVGDHAVCVGPDGPVGVLDDDENGSADDTRFVDGAVRVLCTPRDGGAEIDVPLSLSNTLWQPAGNQLVPAAGGYNALGPAIVVAPAAGIPTNSDCHFAFAANVTDKDHIQLCATASGEIEDDCTPGDVSAVSFGTEVLRISGSVPQDGSTGVPVTGMDAKIQVFFNTAISTTIPADAVTLTENGVARTDITVARDPNSDTAIVVTVPGGFVAGATYVLTVTGVTDTFGVPLPSTGTASITFTAAT